MGQEPGIVRFLLLVFQEESLSTFVEWASSVLSLPHAPRSKRALSRQRTTKLVPPCQRLQPTPPGEKNHCPPLSPTTPSSACLSRHPCFLEGLLKSLVPPPALGGMATDPVHRDTTFLEVSRKRHSATFASVLTAHSLPLSSFPLLLSLNIGSSSTVSFFLNNPSGCSKGL